jgi:hypothetical protein
VIGTSQGGLATNLLGCTKAPLNALISVMYASNTAHLVWNSAIAKHIKRDFLHAGLPYLDLDKAWKIINPIIQATCCEGKVLLFSGKYDEFITKEDSEELWTFWEKPDRLVMPCGHSGLNVYRKPISYVIYRFVRKVLQGD